MFGQGATSARWETSQSLFCCCFAVAEKGTRRHRLLNRTLSSTKPRPCSTRWAMKKGRRIAPPALPMSQT